MDKDLIKYVEISTLKNEGFGKTNYLFHTLFMTMLLLQNDLPIGFNHPSLIDSPIVDLSVLIIQILENNE